MFVRSCLVKSYLIRSHFNKSCIVRPCLLKSCFIKLYTVLLLVFNHLASWSDWSTWFNSSLCLMDLFWSYAISSLLGVLLKVDLSKVIYKGSDFPSFLFHAYIRSLTLFIYYTALLLSHTIYKLLFFLRIAFTLHSFICYIMFLFSCIRQALSIHVMHLFMYQPGFTHSYTPILPLFICIYYAI